MKATLDITRSESKRGELFWLIWIEHRNVAQMRHAPEVFDALVAGVEAARKLVGKQGGRLCITSIADDRVLAEVTFP